MQTTTTSTARLAKQIAGAEAQRDQYWKMARLLIGSVDADSHPVAKEVALEEAKRLDGLASEMHDTVQELLERKALAEERAR